MAQAPPVVSAASAADAAGGTVRHVVQLLLPLYDNDGVEFSRDTIERVRRELTERFGGVTAYTRAPVKGWWRGEGDGAPRRDDLVILEVLAGTLDPGWWADYRAELERRFRQDRILVRAQAVTLL